MVGEDFGTALRRLRGESGLSLRALQPLVGYNFTYLGQVERGEKPATAKLAAACDEALRTDGALSSVYLESVDGWQDDVTSAQSANGATSSRVAMSGSPLGPERVVGDLERFETEMAALRGLYHRAASPVSLLELARGHLDDLTQLLRRRTPKRTRTRLHQVRSEVALLGGRLTFFDLQDSMAGRAYFTIACEAAVQVSDEALSVAALGHLAFAPSREGDTAAALAHLGEAAVHARRAGVPGLSSWLSAVEAEVVAGVDPPAALRALDLARLSLGHAKDAIAPPWFDYYSAARLEGFAGAALLAAGQPDAARQALGAALGGLEADAVKQRAVLLADLAATYLADDHPDPGRACALGIESAAILKTAGYATGRERLVQLRSRMRRLPGQSIDRQSIHRLDEALADLR
jgi:hypothetical protein